MSVVVNLRGQRMMTVRLGETADLITFENSISPMTTWLAATTLANTSDMSDGTSTNLTSLSVLLNSQLVADKLSRVSYRPRQTTFSLRQNHWTT